jgi:tripartite-type tricarboxylate transporter receptor subunit TctC
MIGFFAPSKTPRSVVDRLNSALVHALTEAAVKERLMRSGVEVAANSPDEFATMIKSDIARTSKVIREVQATG